MALCCGRNILGLFRHRRIAPSPRAGLMASIYVFAAPSTFLSGPISRVLMVTGLLILLTTRVYASCCSCSEYRKNKRPFHPSRTADDCCWIARQLCNTSPHPVAMEVAALKSSPLTLQPSTPPAIRHNESLLRWCEMQLVILRLLSRTAHGLVQLVAPGFLAR